MVKVGCRRSRPQLPYDLQRQASSRYSRTILDCRMQPPAQPGLVARLALAPRLELLLQLGHLHLRLPFEKCARKNVYQISQVTPLTSQWMRSFQLARMVCLGGMMVKNPPLYTLCPLCSDPLKRLIYNYCWAMGRGGGPNHTTHSKD